MEEQSDVAGRGKRLVSQTEQSNSSSLIPQIGRDLSINCLARCSRSDYASIASVNRSFRSLIRTGELHRASRNRGIVEHWVYFSCSPFEWMCLDPVGIRWIHLPRLPSRCFTFWAAEALAVGTELLVFGETYSLNVYKLSILTIHKLSILTNSWSLGREMNEPRCSFGSASLGEIAIVAGGFDAKRNSLNSAEIYNSNTGTWVSLPRMNRPRTKCSGVFMDGNFYVVGGWGGLTCGEMYDLKMRIWHVIPNMFPAQHDEYSAPPLLAVVKNELYAAFYWENEVRKYDKGRNLWSTVGNLPEGPLQWSELALKAYGDQLILIVGLGRGIDVYDCVPDEGPLQWSSLTFNDEPRLATYVYKCTVMSC